VRLAWALFLAVVEVKTATAGRPSIPARTPAQVAEARRLVERGRRFQLIAQGRLPGQHIVYRDKEVTAFLDQKDVQSPAHDPKVFDWEFAAYEDLRDVPKERRAHLLMIPNHWRQHVGPNLGSGLAGRDLATALSIVRKAEDLARELRIIRPKVFINPVHRISVGYLHVHIIGERDPNVPYPQASSR